MRSLSSYTGLVGFMMDEKGLAGFSIRAVSMGVSLHVSI